MTNVILKDGILTTEENMLICGDFEHALKIYQTKEMFVESAYCCVFLNELENAKQFLNSSNDDSPLAFWCKFLVDLFEKKKYEQPTYFQIRNFLEISLNNFFKVGNFDKINELYSEINMLFEINISVYKFFARAYYQNKFYEEGLNLINYYIKNINYNDGEAHFLASEIYIELSAFKEAIKHLKITNELIPNISRVENLIDKLSYK